MSKIIIGALVGAVIGYITNYIAIKMLFKPHTEKRIFGLKVPFTPGLIPKEKNRIAKSVGDSIGEHLLNGITIKKTLKEEKIKRHIDKELKNKMLSVLNSNKSIKEIYEKTFNLEFNKFKNALSKKILDGVFDKLSKDSFKKNINGQLQKFILNELLNKPTHIINFLNKETIKNKIDNILNKFENEQDNKLKELLLNKANDLENSNEKIKEIIPNEFENLVKKFVYDEKDVICNKIYGLFLKEDVSNEIKNTITTNVLGNLSPLVSMFLNVDVLYNKFLEAAEIYFKNEKNQEIIVKVISEELENISNKEIRNILSKIPLEIQKNIIAKASNKITNKIKQRLNADEITEQLKEKVNSYNNYVEILEDLSINYNEILMSFSDKIYNEIKYNEEIKNGIKKLILKFIENIGQQSLNKLINGNKETVISSISLCIQNNYDDFIENKTEKILNILDIPNIVEKEIKNFEVDYAEKIILDIANKELKAITWLGALLGGILGIITPILSKLY